MLACTADNASNNNKLFFDGCALYSSEETIFRYETSRIRCFSHIINLALKEFLKCLKVIDDNPDHEERVNYSDTANDNPRGPKPNAHTVDNRPSEGDLDFRDADHDEYIDACSEDILNVDPEFGEIVIWIDEEFTDDDEVKDISPHSLIQKVKLACHFIIKIFSYFFWIRFVILSCYSGALPNCRRD
jgi:hypothetical protein